VRLIKEDGTKRFAKNSGKHGCFHVIGVPNGPAVIQKIAMSPVAVIAEGYATAVTLARHGKAPTLAAYDSGNLLSVATALHQRYLDKPIIIAGDDDHGGENNSGREALAAAEAVAGVTIFPNLSAEQRAKGFTDFNDLGIQNPEVVSRQLDEVLQGVREQRLMATQAFTAELQEKGREAQRQTALYDEQIRTGNFSN
jgi:putative DNA primase/helicase